MSDRTHYRITVQLLQVSVDYVEAGYRPHRSIARDTSFLSQLLRGGLLALFTCFQRKGWRRRTGLASNQCRRQFYPRTIKRFTCDQTQEHGGSYTSHVEKRLAHRGEARTDDGSQRYIVKTDHTHAFRYEHVVQPERSNGSSISN